jgi:hypothetical protein
MFELFDITHVVKKGDYLYLKVPTHPKATSNGYVLMHRVVKENELGRFLTDDEVVHHKDKDRRNNAPDNLEVMTEEEHIALHANDHRGITFIEFICPNCNVLFQKEIRQLKKNTTPKCSRKCNGAYSRKIQLGLI